MGLQCRVLSMSLDIWFSLIFKECMSFKLGILMRRPYYAACVRSQALFSCPSEMTVLTLRGLQIHQWFRVC